MRASDHRFGLAAEAYIFGYPLVSSVRLQTLHATQGIASVAGRGFNAFCHQREMPGPNSSFVNVDADLLSSMAQVDLAPGPLVLHVPDAGDRYFVLVLIDAWRDAFAYLGTGSGDGAGGAYVLVPPGWARPTPPALTRIEAPTRLLTLFARFSLADPRDASTVYRLQDGLLLQPLDPGARAPEGPPERSKSVCDDLRFWEELRVWLRACPPSPAEAEYAGRFSPLGIFDDPSPYVDPDPALAWSLRGGLRAGRDGLERLASAGRARRNGWSSAPHALDFNVDFLGPGTRDEPAWRMADRDQARIARAMAARQPFGATHGYQNIYATCLVDADGRRLTGAHRYTMDLDPPPAAVAWSLTMYDAPDYYLVDNPLARYWLGSRTPGLRTRPDGSVRIVIQADEPADAADQANWLPSAPGDFRPALRIDRPGPQILELGLAPPSIRRVD